MQGPKPNRTDDGAARATPGADGRQPAEMQADVARLMSRLLHDLNQPLSAITNYAQAGSQLSGSGAASNEQLRSLFDKIVEQSKRAGSISQELRAARDRQGPGQPG